MQLGFHLREMAALVMPVRLFNVLRQDAKMKELWPEFFLSIFVAVTLSAEYLFLGRASWIYDYGAGLEVLPTYLSLIRSGSNFALWQPAIAGGLDRFAFWGTGDSPINLELILFSIFDPWIANGIHVVLQKFCIVFFTALLARQQKRASPGHHGHTIWRHSAESLAVTQPHG